MPELEDRPPDLPDAGGVYLLVFRLRWAARLTVGALGELSLLPGYYCYAGSAQLGLRRRLEHHLSAGGRRLHWHVDYLRRVAEPAYVLVWAGRNANECALSRAAARLLQGTVKGFGSSDCDCEGHLHYFWYDPRWVLGGMRGFPLELIEL